MSDASYEQVVFCEKCEQWLRAPRTATRIRCPKCQHQQRLQADQPDAPVDAEVVSTHARRPNRFARIGFYLGLASILLFELGVVPLAALVCSVIGLSTFNENTENKKWMAGWGLALGVVYLLLNMSRNGHFN
jgi:LSD1 subclass zinc finger protein